MAWCGVGWRGVKWCWMVWCGKGVLMGYSRMVWGGQRKVFNGGYRVGWCG